MQKMPENKYRTLKLDTKYQLPTWDSLIAPMLEIAQTKSTWTTKQLVHETVNFLNLPDQLQTLTYPNNRDEPIIDNRAKWALSDMKISGLLSRPKRGIYQSTDLGKEVFQKYGESIDVKLLHELPKYKEHQAELQKRNKNANISGTEISNTENPKAESKTTLVQKMNSLVTQYNNEIATDLLTRIQEAEPVFFERLVVALLSSMGYQGSNGTAHVTQLSNDGGIDGIIDQDPLGTQTVYLQAKRYRTGHNVQRKEIQAFRGALEDIHASRGVFITTSSFTKGAKDSAARQNIVLIDGIRLTDLMLQYRVGVEVKHHYDTFAVDDDFFDDDE